MMRIVLRLGMAFIAGLAVGCGPNVTEFNGQGRTLNSRSKAGATTPEQSEADAVAEPTSGQGAATTHDFQSEQDQQKSDETQPEADKTLDGVAVRLTKVSPAMLPVVEELTVFGEASGDIILKDGSEQLGQASPDALRAGVPVRVSVYGSHRFVACLKEGDVCSEPFPYERPGSGVLTNVYERKAKVAMQLGKFGGKALFAVIGTDDRPQIVTVRAADRQVDVIDAPENLGKGSIIYSASLRDTVLFLNRVPGNFELWRTDGTKAGTSRVQVFDQMSDSCNTAIVPLDATRAIFVTTSANFGYRLWVSDGTTGGTQLIREFPYGGFSFCAPGLTQLGSGDVLFLDATVATVGTLFWRTDGTAAGTRPAIQIPAGQSLLYASGGVKFGEHLIFSSSTEGDMVGQLGDRSLAKLNFKVGLPTRKGVLGDKLFFANDNKLFVMDGTPNGVRLVKAFAGLSFWDLMGTLGDRLLVAGDGKLGRVASDATSFEELPLPLSEVFRGEVSYVDGQVGFVGGGQRIWRTGGSVDTSWPLADKILSLGDALIRVGDTLVVFDFNYATNDLQISCYDLKDAGAKALAR